MQLTFKSIQITIQLFNYAHLRVNLHNRKLENPSLATTAPPSRLHFQQMNITYST